MAIIALLVVVGASALNNGGGRSMAVAQAADEAAALVEQARLAAISVNVGAKLVIDNDPASSYRLRRIAVFKPWFDEGTREFAGWTLSGRPLILPEGVYLLESYSSGFNRTERFDFRGAGRQNGTSGGGSLVIDFDREGRLVDSANTRMVFARASAPATTPPDSLLNGRRGFLLRKYASPVSFESVDQMPPASNP